MESRERNVVSYRTPAERFPFREWRKGITDENSRAAIDARLARLRGGNFGCSESIGSGASENKIDFGPGFRIYYGIDGEDIVLLCGGDKSTQDRDIQDAIKYWTDYRRRKKARRESLAQRNQEKK
jgi:putative addiction module killer protein